MNNSGSRNDRKLRMAWARAGGPLLSLLFHAAVVLALISFVAPGSSMVTPAQVEVAVVDAAEIDLDELIQKTELDEPLMDDIRTPDLASPEMSAALEAALEMPAEAAGAVDQPADSLLSLDLASPLIMKNLGADAGSRAALTASYGQRALQHGLFGSYFDNVDFTGTTATRIDETLNKLWEEASPWPGRVPRDCFSVIWTGRIVPKRSGTYTFYLQSDDGARLWINGEVVLDQFNEHSRQTDTVQVKMLAGLSYDIKYAFCDVFIHAISQLEWSSVDAGVKRQLVPTDCLWADGASTRELLRWNERAENGGPYVNRTKMRNPAMLEGVAFSHIVGHSDLTEEGLARIGLKKLAPEFRRFKEDGTPPASLALPSGRDERTSVVEASASEDDIKIEVY